LFVVDIGVEEGFFGAEVCAIEPAPPIEDFAIALGAGAHDGVVVVGEVEVPGKPELFEVAQRFGCLCSGLSLSEDGE
jgi:hypothetical protein